MHVTVYSRDLEPITVIWLAPWAVRMLTEHRCIAFAAIQALQASSQLDAIPQHENWVIRMRGEQLRLGVAQTWILIADDEELALMLRSAFLPGQHRAVREIERQAKSEGAAMALSIIRQLGRGGIHD